MVGVDRHLVELELGVVVLDFESLGYEGEDLLVGHLDGVEGLDHLGLREQTLDRGGFVVDGFAKELIHQLDDQMEPLFLGELVLHHVFDELQNAVVDANFFWG